MRTPLIILFSVLTALAPVPEASRAQNTLPREDAIRIAEARDIAERFGDAIWAGWGGAPFAILLVGEDKEYLVYHPEPTPDFTPAGYDSLIRSDVHVRARVFERGFQATFPAVGGVATIVIGRPKNTEAGHSSRWVLTVLHEHFHQWQFSQPDYYESVGALDLARGDSTGMWMLNYDFPYDSTGVRNAFKDLCTALSAAIETVDDALWEDKLKEYRGARSRFERTLTNDDYRYFSFQLWQEGVARYTEYLLALTLASTYEPTPEFADLPDYVPFEKVEAQIKKRIVAALTTMDLAEQRRTAFYHAGAAEAMVLDRYYPWWKQHYMEERFFLERYFELRPY